MLNLFNSIFKWMFTIFACTALLTGLHKPTNVTPFDSDTVSVDESNFQLVSDGDAPLVTQGVKPIVTRSNKGNLSQPVRELKPRIDEKALARQVKEVPTFALPKARESDRQSRGNDRAAEMRLSPLLQEDSILMPSPLQSFDGVSNLFFGWPPDTQGDIGPNHYVQWINLHFAIWQIDKVNNTSNLIYGPVPGNTLFQGFGGVCETTNDGDPITLYDPFSDRWFMSQFALPNWPYGPFYECVAVSQTPDPTGAWYRYQFEMPVDKMNDYPKFGVWPNAYFMTVNQFNAGTMSYGGAGVAALEREAMLVGAPARMVYFDLYSVNNNFGGMLPADFDGIILPPAGSPGYFLEWDDGAWIPTQDALRLWEFHVDWVDPDNSTFGVNGQPDQVIPTMDVDPNLCGGSRNCIPQPGTSVKVDAIADRLLYRLQYRNLGGVEALVSNHSVDVDGTDHAGIHWLELHSSGGVWSIHQEGVYSADPDNRWMGSMAMDHDGNIALGYSVSSSSTYPSVRYAGRLANDPLGSLPQGEQSLVEGSGSQTGSSRWGDYSAMNVDPIDDCTFWYTQQYLATTGSSTWKTRIGSFRFPGCSIGPQGTLQGEVTDSGNGEAIEEAQVRATLDVTRTLSTLSHVDGSYSLKSPVGTYDMNVSAYGYITGTVSGVEVFSGTVTHQDFALDPAPLHNVSGIARDANTGWPLYVRIEIDGSPLAPIWTDPLTGYYSVDLPEGSVFTFNVESFVDGYLTTSVAVGPLTGNLVKDILLEVDENTCNAPGYRLDITSVYTTNLEVDNGGITVTGSITSWEWGEPLSGPNSAHSSLNVWATNLLGNYGNNENGYLTLPPVDLSAFPGQRPVLNWWQWLVTEAGFDTASIEFSKDGGSTWNRFYGPVSGEVDLDWTEYNLILDPSYAVSDFKARFRFYSDGIFTDPGWYIDDLSVGVGECVPQDGGLVVGNVFDANTSEGLVGATVLNEAGEMTSSQSTPDDDAVADGFYALFSPDGTNVFTATLSGGYGKDVESVNVPIGDTVLQDFELPAGWFVVQPSSLEIGLDLGLTATLPLTVSNLGSAPGSFSLVELDGGFVPSGPFEEPAYVVKPFKQNLPSTGSLSLPAQPSAPLLAAGEVIQAWSPDGLSNLWGIAYDGVSNSLWVSSPSAAWSGEDTLAEYSSEGAPTGRAHTHSLPHTTGPGDLAYNWNSGKLWIVDVGASEERCIYEIDPEVGYTGNAICPGGGDGFLTSQRGLAYDPSTDTWFAGSWNDLMIYRFDSNGNILSRVFTGLAISGLAYNPDTEHLFAMVNADPSRVYVLDVSNNYSILGMFNIGSGFGAYTGSGLEIDCDGNLWAVDQNSDDVHQVFSGERADLCSSDVPWLSESPINQTLAPLETQVVTVTFDAGVPGVDQPGTYLAQLMLEEDTPYETAMLQVMMQVDAPPNWGKLNGTVTGLGYCDINPAPIEAAEVLIEDSSGLTLTVMTAAGGTYQRWLDELGNPYTLTVTAAEHTPVQATGLEVSGGITVTQDFNLRWLKPCVEAEPNGFVTELKLGKTLTLPLTMTNSGAVASIFDIVEIPLDPLIPPSGPEILQPAGESPMDARAAPEQIGYSEPVHIPLNPGILLEEGFEQGVMPPSEWTRIINNPRTWTLDSALPHSGSYNAHVLYDYNQDEWLVSPVLYLNEGVLSFWSFGSFYWCRVTNDNCDLNVWIVVGEVGGGDDIYVGRADEDWTSSWTWSQSVMDLTPLLPGGAVRIGFQYLGDDGAEVALDEIFLDGIEEGDVPWLSLSPISGTLPADTGEQLVNVNLDAGVPEVNQSGEFHALLRMENEDPENGIVTIPITLTVLPLEYGVDISPDMESHDIPGEIVQFTVNVTNTSEGPEDSFVLSMGEHSWPTELDNTQVGPLAMGESESVIASVFIPQSASGGEVDSVVVTATSQGDPNKMDSNTLTTLADIPLADLEIIKSPSSDPVNVGFPLTYTIVITNHGPTKAVGVTLVDVLPNNVSYLSDDTGCSLTGSVLVCELGKFNLGEARIVKVIVRPMSLGVLVNQAVVLADTEDPNQNNNWGTTHTISEGYLYYFPIIARD